MARLRADPVAEARTEFLTEIRVKRAYYNVKQAELAYELDIGAPRMSALLSKPDDLSAARLRQIIKRLRLDPVIVLRFLGYTTQDIKKIGGGGS